MRQRIEDLGRLAILLQNLLDHQLFDEHHLTNRPKHYLEWFDQLSKDKKDEIVRSWAYGIDDLRGKIYDLLAIAEGTDILNERENKIGDVN